MMTHTIQTINQKELPQLLQQIQPPPRRLFARGNTDLLHSRCLSIVGSRKITNYGRAILHEIIPPLLPYLTIVSGLAFGVDALAHELALKHNGRTIAFLPGGVDNQSISPKSNFTLARRMLEQKNLLLSEYEPGQITHKGHFQERNRLIAGISPVTLVIEAAQKSGSLITAFHALDYNRDLAVIPGNINSTQSAGTNMLAQRGAHIITCADDILKLYDITLETASKIPYQCQNSDEMLLLTALQNQPHTIDTLAQSCKLSVKKISSTLFLLELRNVIKRHHQFIHVNTEYDIIFTI